MAIIYDLDSFYNVTFSLLSADIEESSKLIRVILYQTRNEY